MQRAIEIHQEQNGKSLRAICSQAKEECLKEDGKVIKLSKSTLQRCINGGRSHIEAHKKQKLLNKAEEDMIIHNIIESAARGIPLNHQHIKEKVNTITCARRGDSFLGVGKNWTSRFIAGHNDQLGSYWSRALDHSHARAVNPFTHEEYFELLRLTIEGKGRDDVIPPELIYGCDETGFQKGVGQKEQVFGAKGKHVQHQQRSGDRELITAIITICGDGTVLPLAVIFKGKGFQVTWKQNNPMNAS
jgi:hypothetical protein